jgi:5-methylcytosine-specific restriction endonuclease McrA
VPAQGSTLKRITDEARYGSRWTKKSRLFRRANPICYCDRVRVWRGTVETVEAFGEPGSFREARLVDHVRPLSAGGEDTVDNYQSLCYHCHATKTARFG